MDIGVPEPAPAPAPRPRAGVARSLAAETAKGAAQGAAAGGVGAAAGAAKGAAKAVGKALLRSRKGRAALAGVALAAALPGLLVGGVVLAGIAEVSGTGLQARSAATSTALASLPLTAAQQQAFLAAQRSTGVPWEVPAAIYYYEGGPGAGLLGQAGACAGASTSAGVSGAGTSGATGTTGVTGPGTPGNSGGAGLVPLGCPPTVPAGGSSSSGASGASGTSGASASSTTTAGLTALIIPAKAKTKTSSSSTTTTVPSTTTTTRPPIVYLGPLQIRQRALPAAERTQASSLSWSAGWVSTRIAQFLADDLTWQSGYNLADGVVFSPDGPPMMSAASVSAKVVQSAYTAAIAGLPLQAMSQTGATNVFELAQDWFVASSPANGGYSAGLGVICGALTGKTLTVPTPAGAYTTLDAGQLTNAAEAVAETKTVKMPVAAAVIAVMTGLTESDLYDLPNSAVPGSESFPGVQWGGYSPSNPPSNGTSVGIYQQQDNWGSVTRRMTVSRATKTFLGHSSLPNPPRGLAGIPGWESLPPGVAAQDVQGSAYPTRYAGWQAAADKVVGAVEGVPCSTAGNPTSLAGVHGTAKKIVAAAESKLGVPYVWGGGDDSGPTTGLAGTPPAGFDCSGLVLYALAQVGIQVPHYSGLGGQWSAVKAYGHYSTDPSTLVPGDLVFFTGSDGTRTNPGHVGIVVGHDEMIDAPQVGQNVSYASFGPGTGFGAAFVGGGPLW